MKTRIKDWLTQAGTDGVLTDSQWTYLFVGGMVVGLVGFWVLSF